MQYPISKIENLIAQFKNLVLHQYTRSHLESLQNIVAFNRFFNEKRYLYDNNWVTGSELMEKLNLHIALYARLQWNHRGLGASSQWDFLDSRLSVAYSLRSMLKIPHDLSDYLRWCATVYLPKCGGTEQESTNLLDRDLAFYMPLAWADRGNNIFLHQQSVTIDPESRWANPESRIHAMLAHFRDVNYGGGTPLWGYGMTIDRSLTKSFAPPIFGKSLHELVESFDAFAKQVVTDVSEESSFDSSVDYRGTVIQSISVLCEHYLMHRGKNNSIVNEAEAYLQALNASLLYYLPTRVRTYLSYTATDRRYNYKAGILVGTAYLSSLSVSEIKRIEKKFNEIFQFVLGQDLPEPFTFASCIAYGGNDSYRIVFDFTDFDGAGSTLVLMVYQMIKNSVLPSNMFSFHFEINSSKGINVSRSVVLNQTLQQRTFNDNIITTVDEFDRLTRN